MGDEWIETGCHMENMDEGKRITQQAFPSVNSSGNRK